MSQLDRLDAFVYYLKQSAMSFRILERLSEKAVATYKAAHDSSDLVKVVSVRSVGRRRTVWVDVDIAKKRFRLDQCYKLKVQLISPSQSLRR